MNILQTLSQEFNLNFNHVQNIVSLLDDGNTVPFIARYRKEMTGACDDQILRNLSDRLSYLRSLETRKGEVAKGILEQGKMTPEIETALYNALTLTEVEDIYRPYKQKRKTRASVAIAKGLQPLADLIFLQKDNIYVEEAEKYHPHHREGAEVQRLRLRPSRRQVGEERQEDRRERGQVAGGRRLHLRRADGRPGAEGLLRRRHRRARLEVLRRRRRRAHGRPGGRNHRRRRHQRPQDARRDQGDRQDLPPLDQGHLRRL